MLFTIHIYMEKFFEILKITINNRNIIIIKA